jgi:hypothetical protein
MPSTSHETAIQPRARTSSATRLISQVLPTRRGGQHQDAAAEIQMMQDFRAFPGSIEHGDIRGWIYFLLDKFILE